MQKDTVMPNNARPPNKKARDEAVPQDFRQFEWDCDERGCFNIRRRLRFGVFYHCFPNRISLTDIDGMVEIKGNFLMLEGKPPPEGGGTDGIYIPTGQRIMFERFTARLRGSIVYVVELDAENMEVFRFQPIFQGEVGELERGNLDKLCKEIEAWANWAQVNPAI